VARKASNGEIERRVSDVHPLVLAGFRLCDIRRFLGGDSAGPHQAKRS